jgi:formylglycine-generating enzyme required for sulfatase activity
MRYFRIACIAAVLCSAVGLQALADETVGLASSAPAGGPSVKTDQGYMVPYEMTIPGTDATFEMVPVPGGTFKLGSPESEDGRDESEGPQIEVTVPPMWVGKYEVTWDAYRSYMNLYGIFKELETRKLRPVTDDNRIDAITAPTELYDPSYTFEFGEEPKLPAVTMTQYAARQFTKWLSGVTGHFYRLPSEAEWEYACRGGTETAYSFGDDPDDLEDYAWYYDNSEDGPSEVGQKEPNPFGLYDMHGNVAEWVLDQMLEDGYEQFAGKRLTAAEALVWPTKLVPRVVKGGSWEDDPEACRSAARLGSEEEDWKMEDPNLPLSPWWFTGDPTRGIGFRVVRPLEVPTDRAEKERYWAIDAEETQDGVDNRMLEGRGVFGLVDPELPAAIKEMTESR